VTVIIQMTSRAMVADASSCAYLLLTAQVGTSFGGRMSWPIGANVMSQRHKSRYHLPEHFAAFHTYVNQEQL